MSRLRFSSLAIALAIAGTTTAQGEYFVGEQPISELNQPGSSNFSPTVSESELYMVFASDRPGGQGGYDLYETIRNGGWWTEGSPGASRPRSKSMDDASPGSSSPAGGTTQSRSGL